MLTWHGGSWLGDTSGRCFAHRVLVLCHPQKPYFCSTRCSTAFPASDTQRSRKCVARTIVLHAGVLPRLLRCGRPRGSYVQRTCVQSSQIAFMVSQTLNGCIHGRSSRMIFCSGAAAAPEAGNTLMATTAQHPPSAYSCKCSIS